MPVAFKLSINDQAELNQYDDAIQQRVHMLLDCFARVAKSKVKVVDACLHEARTLGHQKTFTCGSIKRLYYTYIKSGDFRELIDKRLRKDITREKKGLSDETIEFFRGLCDKNKRSCKAGYRRLIDMWYNDEPIPGIGNWSARFRDAHPMQPLPDIVPDPPDGFSYQNFMRFAPTHAEKVLSRQGIAAALAILPSCISTRVGLRPFEFVTFDDAELDFMIHDPASGQICRLQGLFSLDVATACALRFGLRPAIIRTEDGKKDSLKALDMERLIIKLLTTFGFPRDWQMTFVCERGTATVREAFKRALYENTGGRVLVTKTGMVAGKVLEFADQPIGNPRAKGWMESWFNLLHNYCGALPGQKGRLYTLAPRELEVRRKSAQELVKLRKMLPAELALQTRTPFFDLHQADASILDLVLRINARTDHKCEGFDQLKVWTAPTRGVIQPQPYENLSGISDAWLDDVRVETRVETPLERYARLMHDTHMLKLHDSAVAALLQTHRVVTVRDYEVTITIDGKEYRYLDAASDLMLEGAEYLAYINEDDLSKIYLTNGKGAYLGTLPLRERMTRGDVEMLKRQIAQKQHILKQHINAIQNRNGDVYQNQLADINANIELCEMAESVVSATPEHMENAEESYVSENIYQGVTSASHIEPVDAVAVLMERKKRRATNDNE